MDIEADDLRHRREEAERKAKRKVRFDKDTHET